MKASPTGVGRFALSERGDVYGAWTPVHGTPWTLILAIPAAPADAPLSRSLGALAALLVIVLVASGLFAWLMRRR